MRHAAILLGVSCLFLQQSALAQQPRADSLRAIATAQAAQAHFERVRRNTAPLSADEQPPCDVKVGRMCYWSDEGNQIPPREPSAVVKTRLALIATLDTLSQRSPHDDWILGQRVRYMVQADEDSGAVAVTRACASARWSCRVLLGYALHESERFGDAAAQFDTAFAEMPLAERCRWNDISVLLGDAEREKYSAIPCGQRDSVERRFWELAQPSFAVAGNDRRTEHFARVLIADLSENAVNVYGLTWGPDMREVLIRYGEPRWYTTPWRQAMDGFPATMGHDRTPSFHFAAEMSSGAAHWDVYDRLARERYAPAYIDTVTALDVQFAMMKRGDSALVLAVYGGGEGHAVLDVVGAGFDSTAGSSKRVRRARSPWRGEMVAMELFDPRTRVDARAREWLQPPVPARGAPDLSTLLLFDADPDVTVESLDDALAHALTANELDGKRRVGLYWETYRDRTPASHPDSTPGVPDDTSRAALRSDSGRAVADSQSQSADSAATVSVTVVRTDGGVLRWLQSALHITPQTSPIAVHWHDSGAGGPIAAHSLVVDLTQLPAGEYRVTVDAGPDAAHRTEIARDIRLR